MQVDIGLTPPRVESAWLKVLLESTVLSSHWFQIFINLHPYSLAGLLHSLLDGVAPEAALEKACNIGAYVATQRGATPPHDQDGIAAIKAGAGKA